MLALVYKKTWNIELKTLKSGKRREFENAKVVDTRFYV